MIDDLTRSILEQRDNIENQRNREIKSNEKIIERTPQEVHDNIVKLLQENKQLKEELELKSGMNIAVQNLKLIEENNQLKEVIEEVREYIDNNTEFEHDGDEYGYTEWVNIKPQNIVFINELLQILDKIKGE